MMNNKVFISYFFICIWFITSIITFGQGRNIINDKYSRIFRILNSKDPKIFHFDEKKYIGESKCGLWFSFLLLSNWNLLDRKQKSEIQALLDPKVMQKERIIGNFKIQYDTIGINAPALLDENYNRIEGTAEQFIDSVGKYFNETWEYLFYTLGYRIPPVRDNDKYFIRVSELGGGLYGQTIPEPDPFGYSPLPLHYSYIEIDNDFKNVYTPSRGLPALKVTAAHEFFHAVQFASYGFRNADRYFYEITATWMEDVIFDEVNDYYQYLSNSLLRSSQFSYPDINFTTSNNSIEYSRAIWAKFIEKKYNVNVIRQVWEKIPHFLSITAHDEVLWSFGSSFRSAYVEYAVWNANTGPKADTVKYYKEGRNYPVIRQRTIKMYEPPSFSFQDSIQPLSFSYNPIVVSNDNQMLVIVLNLNLGKSYDYSKYQFVYHLADIGDDSYRKLSNGISVKLEVPDIDNWTTYETVPTIVEDAIVYPNPFYANGKRYMSVRIPYTNYSTASLSIYTSSFNKVITKDVQIDVLPSLVQSVRWNGIDENGNIVGTGVYFFFLDVGTKQYKGKFIVIRE